MTGYGITRWRTDRVNKLRERGTMERLKVVKKCPRPIWEAFKKFRYDPANVELFKKHSPPERTKADKIYSDRKPGIDNHLKTRLLSWKDKDELSMRNWTQKAGRN